jgi:hypothetical protein
MYDTKSWMNKWTLGTLVAFVYSNDMLVIVSAHVSLSLLHHRFYIKHISTLIKGFWDYQEEKSTTELAKHTEQ